MRLGTANLFRLRNEKATHLICEVFKHSPVFRMGGDAFSVIVKNEDDLNLDALLEQFDAAAAQINASGAEPCEQVHLSKGFAVFSPMEDSAVTDVMRRADQLMYENKRERKNSGNSKVSGFTAIPLQYQGAFQHSYPLKSPCFDSLYGIIDRKRIQISIPITRENGT